MPPAAAAFVVVSFLGNCTEGAIVVPRNFAQFKRIALCDADRACYEHFGYFRFAQIDDFENLGLVEIGARLGRLIATFRSARKEKKVLAGVWAGLRQLYFAGGS